MKEICKGGNRMKKEQKKTQKEEAIRGLQLDEIRKLFAEGKDKEAAEQIGKYNKRYGTKIGENLKKDEDFPYSITNPEELRLLCIRKNWFTAGGNEQYKKMFDMNKEKRPLEEIALAIWLCSEDVSREEILKELKEVREDAAF